MVVGLGEDRGGAAIIDLHFHGHPGLIACCALESPEGILLVDPGPPSTLPALLAGLEAAGIRESDLHALLITHIHVDHSGAAGSLARRNPGLRVYVHEKGAPHLAAPERLLDYVAKLYRDPSHSNWGIPEPVPQDQLVPLSGGETLSFGGRAIEVRYAPGHARHHVIYFDRAGETAYTGDAAGVRADCCRAVLPYAPPPDIALEAWQESLAWLEEARPRRLMLTHFGPVDDPPRHLAEFRRRLASWTALARSAAQPESAGEFARLALEELRASAPDLNEDRLSLICNLEHCWMGLSRALGREIRL